MGDNYSKMSDEDLVLRYQGGDLKAADFLVEKYKNLVRKNVRSYYLVGADNEDLIQEGMVGLFKAIRDYNPKRDTIFMTFASLCISRHIRSVVTSYNRKKNGPLNTYVSFDEKINDDTDDSFTVKDTLYSETRHNPEELLIAKEQIVTIKTLIDENLSKFERQVLELYIEGLSYTEIAKIVAKPPKSIDNAIQRIRNKISKNC